MIDINLSEFKRDDINEKNIESYSKELFQIINCFAKSTNLVEFDIFLFFWKFNVNFAVNIIVEKNDFDIHLFQFSIKSDDESENDFVAHKFHYENENFFVIKILSLFKITNYSARFMTNDFVVEIFFQFKNSTITENSVMNKTIHKISNVIFDEKLDFVNNSEFSCHLVIDINHDFFVNLEFLRFCSIKNDHDECHQSEKIKKKIRFCSSKCLTKRCFDFVRTQRIWKKKILKRKFQSEKLENEFLIRRWFSRFQNRFRWCGKHEKKIDRLKIWNERRMQTWI